MKEIVVISGKGGTGKTSIVASFAALAENAVFADCDVDAADLHLILEPEIRSVTEFKSGQEAVIVTEKCAGCGECMDLCRFDAIACRIVDGRPDEYYIDSVNCEGCGVCVHFCPAGAIDFPERLCGEWYISDSRFGPVVHARLGIAAENSGKLVSLVRHNSRKLAEEKNCEIILVDGPPGIGCPVIASVTGADAVIVVTEPTLSGEHDLERVLSLTKHFKIPAIVCINKWDINPEIGFRIESKAEMLGAVVAGRIPYDDSVTKAQVLGKAVVEYNDGEASRNIRSLWIRVNDIVSEIDIIDKNLKQGD
ncbi:MAG TPA: 4Fe-4S dicluster domain-containing protein [Firmicutes bacterium]|nr:4Fe-4S dicluster domain-containing protein [Bacillota bacterium]